MLAYFPLAPGIIAADRNLQRLAQQCDCVLLTVLSDELKLHSWPREKMPIAFFKISRSCRRRSFSRFKWRISSSCGVLGLWMSAPWKCLLTLLREQLAPMVQRTIGNAQVTCDLGHGLSTRLH